MENKEGKKKEKREKELIRRSIQSRCCPLFSQLSLRCSTHEECDLSFVHLSSVGAAEAITLPIRSRHALTAQNNELIHGFAIKTHSV